MLALQTGSLPPLQDLQDMRIEDGSSLPLDIKLCRLPHSQAIYAVFIVCLTPLFFCLRHYVQNCLEQKSQLYIAFSIFENELGSYRYHSWDAWFWKPQCLLKFLSLQKFKHIFNKWLNAWFPSILWNNVPGVFRNGEYGIRTLYDSKLNVNCWIYESLK